jgi:pimeloyl-ACP methyl ester carboxylesterase
VSTAPHERAIKMIEVGPARIAVSAEGEGPDLVLVHAGVADLRMWDPLAALVRHRFRVIRYDMRGFGRTEAPAGEFSPAADLAAVIEATGARLPTLAGASFGGYVALEYAAGAWHTLDRLVLLDPPLFDHDWSARMEAFDAAETAAFERGDLDTATDLNVDMWAGHSSPEVRELVRTMQRDAFAKQAQAEPEPVEIEPPASTRLGSIGVRTDVVHGDRDVDDFRAIAERLANELPDARLHRVEGAGHLPALDRPEAVAEILLGG